MATADQIKKAMRARLTSLPTMSIIELFEASETMDNSAELFEVRGVLLDELEARNAQAFAAWMECADPALAVKPSVFFNV